MHKRACSLPSWNVNKCMRAYIYFDVTRLAISQPWNPSLCSMATAVTKTNSKPPQIETSARSAVGVGSTGNADEELEDSSTENAERKLIKDSIGNTTRDEGSAETEDRENCPSVTWQTVASFFSRAWRWLYGPPEDSELNCSVCNKPLDLKKSQLKDQDGASTIRCQK